MLTFFEHSKTEGVELIKPELILVKEFANLFEPKWNKGTGDTRGQSKYKAKKALAFVYLTADWKSPYAEFSENEKLEAALEDIEIMPGPELDINDDRLTDAIEKYKHMQATRTLKLLNSAYRAIDELRIYFDTVDLQERDEQYGKPIYTAKDIVSNISNLGKLVRGLEELEQQVKKEIQAETGLRGDAEPGLFD